MLRMLIIMFNIPVREFMKFNFHSSHYGNYQIHVGEHE